ncbi:MAG: NAD-dependent epimerase/dehydratase family protein [Candidatus Verstraetearchaeota archaeon]|nr:NAD-dependent epimerase/dehydratase family protein [Candidatus Verstraetearchaeota archaeon]
MVVLVTGGSGFIGSHLVDKLIKKGYDVRVFDKVKPHREDVQWVNGSLLNEDEVVEACTDVNQIFHLAAIADVNMAIANPQLCIQVNEVGTLNVVRAGMAKEVERVLLASSTWVYGKLRERVDENTPLPHPDHVYTKTKIGQEHLLTAWNSQYGLPYTILRYDIPYGPRMRSNMAIAIFTRKAMSKEPITIMGDGSQGRNWVYVEDLVEGNVAAMKPGGKNQIFNLSGKEFVTMFQIVGRLKEMFGDIPIEHKPPRPGDFKGMIVSAAKAKELLGWEAKHTFKEGLRKYVAYVKAKK